jgi:hypothetical protein
MTWQPTATIDALRKRAEIIVGIRDVNLIILQGLICLIFQKIVFLQEMVRL